MDSITISLNDFMNYVTLTISIVALIVTVVAFFASLKFYREGVELQQAASNSLVKLDEKINSLQNQVFGMYNKTLCNPPFLSGI